MGSEILTKEQEEFLDECNLEFSERFTDSDVEFKKVLDSEIPPPPIVTPWYGKQRFNNRDRNRPGGSYNNFRDQAREDRDINNHYGDRGYSNRDRYYRQEGRGDCNNHYGDRGGQYNREKHYRPY